MFDVKSYCWQGDKLSIVLIFEKIHDSRFATIIETNYQDANLFGFSIEIFDYFKVVKILRHADYLSFPKILNIFLKTISKYSLEILF